MGIWYCTREDVKSALDFKETARNNVQVDRAIEASSRALEGFLHRKFYPLTATRYFDWPNNQYAQSWRLWLDENELVRVTSLMSGAATILDTQYNLEPVNSGPPYNRIELKLSGSGSFGLSNTHQRDVRVVGVWYYEGEEVPVGTLAEALDGSETGIDVSDSSIGVGDILKVDDERMIVTAKTMLDTTQNLGTNLTASNADVTVAVSNGTLFTVGETILVDAEMMFIVNIAGNNLIVKRAWDGSVLATHTSTADIYAARTLTVTRGALGTTAVSHLTSTGITKHAMPTLIKQLCVAEALNQILQETSGYARVVGSGDNERELAGKALSDIRSQAYATHGRKARTGAI